MNYRGSNKGLFFNIILWMYRKLRKSHSLILPQLWIFTSKNTDYIPKSLSNGYLCSRYYILNCLEQSIQTVVQQIITILLNSFCSVFQTSGPVISSGKYTKTSLNSKKPSEQNQNACINYLLMLSQVTCRLSQLHYLPWYCRSLYD